MLVENQRTEDLGKLVVDWQTARHLRDGGETAKALWTKIEALATDAEKVAILRDEFLD